ncbi:MAG: peptidoglycan editing factor PgeF [Salinivirgaceae bacterium]|jgi:YfiH family protein|nr:peptidoglycan editing factor PgeF [Salinivirgaceae bacterium]
MKNIIIADTKLFQFSIINTNHVVTRLPFDMHRIYGSENRKILAKAMQARDNQIVFPKQTHGAAVGVVRSTNESFPETDALITKEPGIAIAVETADCVPILLFDPVKRVAAAIHAGWRSTSKQIVVKTIQQMEEVFGVVPSDIRAGIGPSVSQKVYEVGRDVYDKFTNVDKKYADFFKPKPHGKYMLDLWQCNAFQMKECGVPNKQIEISELCTVSSPELFYSARREGINTGRLAAVIMV